MSQATMQAPTSQVADAEASRSRKTIKSQHIRTWADWMTLVLLIVGALIMLFPLIILAMNAFKTIADYNATGPLTLPAHPTMRGIESFWKSSNFPLKFLNSFVISLVVAVLGVLLSVLNSFALGIGRVKGNRWIILLIMLANMMPQEALLYPPLHHVQRGRYLQYATVYHHYFYGGPKCLRYLLAVSSLQYFPSGNLGSCNYRRSYPLADPH